jgi:hypothetical protein
VVVGSRLWLAGCAARVWSWVGRDGTPGHVREYRALTALGFVLRGFMTIMSYSGYAVVELVTIQDPLTQYAVHPQPRTAGDRPSRGLHPSSSSSGGHGQVSSPSDRPEEKTTEGSAGGNVVADGGRSTRNSLQQEKIGSHVDSCQLKLSTCHMLPQIQ